ncbi:30S ribosomal protein S18 [Patescibacteria group bacterium]
MPTPTAKQTRVCRFCVDRDVKLDYKDSKTLGRYLSPYSAILGRRKTGTCAKHQRELTRAIKHARFLALLPYIPE